MATKSLTEEIHDWIGGLEYWEQCLAIKILSKQAITDSDLKLAYKYFLEDNGLAEKKTAQPKIKIAAAITKNPTVNQNLFISKL